MAGGKQPPQTISEAPTELKTERESFVRDFMRKGLEFAEGLIVENHGLRAELDGLRLENGQLRSKLETNDPLRELSKDIEELQQERTDLLDRSQELEQTRQQIESSYREIEEELSELASLFVASTQLGRTLSPQRVVRHLLELMEQLVGAQSAVLYTFDEHATALVPTAAQGVDLESLSIQPVEDTVVGDACLTGLTRVKRPPTAGSEGDPVAVVPLMLGDEAIAAIAILELLPQKPDWARVDEELFKLLAGHGPRALVAANLYDQHDGPRQVLASLRRRLGSTDQGGDDSPASDMGA